MNFYQLYHSDSYLREMEAVVMRVEIRVVGHESKGRTNKRLRLAIEG